VGRRAPGIIISIGSTGFEVTVRDLDTSLVIDPNLTFALFWAGSSTPIR